jgi:hypothetical protein
MRRSTYCKKHNMLAQVKKLVALGGAASATALLALLAPPALAFGQATFQCGGAEFSTTWYGRQKHERDLTFPLTTTTVDGKTYTVRFLARALNGTFSGVNISNPEEKFTLYHDRLNKVHQLTYEPAQGKLIKATCTITEYR